MDFREVYSGTCAMWDITIKSGCAIRISEKCTQVSVVSGDHSRVAGVMYAVVWQVCTMDYRYKWGITVTGVLCGFQGSLPR